MSAQILDGKILAKNLKEQLKQDIARMKQETTGVPHVVNLMIGRPAESLAYAASQQRVAQELGISYALKHLLENMTQPELLGVIQKLNKDSKVHGIMIHKPFPAQLNYQEAANAIAIEKDLEGINVANLGRMLLDDMTLVPCTAAAAMEHIRATGVALRGKEAVIVGVSEIVGKPMMLLLLKERATVTLCHRGTNEAGKLVEHVGKADIVVVAIGKPEMVKGEWIKKGAIVIDVGINQVNNKLVGDVEYETAKERAGFITPVPGGVGPVTVVMLMRNVVAAYKRQTSK